MKLESTQRLAKLLAGMACMVLSASLSASTVPTTWDFGSGPGKVGTSDFTFNSSNANFTWGPLEEDAWAWSDGTTGGSARSFGSTQFSDLGNGANQDFTANLSLNAFFPRQYTSVYVVALAADNTIGALEANAFSAGLANFGGSTSSPNGPAHIVMRDAFPGLLENKAFGSVTVADIANTDNNVIFSLSGTYSGSDLILDFTVSISGTVNHTQTESVTIANTHRDGQYFGFAFDTPGTSVNQFGEIYSIAVIPEPGTYAAIFGVAVLGAVLMLRRRKVA